MGNFADPEKEDAFSLRRPVATQEAIPDSPLVPYGPHREGPFGPAPSDEPNTRGLNFYYPSDKKRKTGLAYVRDDYVYRCRNADNVAAGFAALAATQAHSDKTRKEREAILPVDPAHARSIGPEQARAINDAIAAVCHHPDQEGSTTSLGKDVDIRSKRPLMSPLHQFFESVVPDQKK